MHSNLDIIIKAHTAFHLKEMSALAYIQDGVRDSIVTVLREVSTNMVYSLIIKIGDVD